MKDTCKAFHTFHDQMLLSIHVSISYWFVQNQKKVLQIYINLCNKNYKRGYEKGLSCKRHLTGGNVLKAHRYSF